MKHFNYDIIKVALCFMTVLIVLTLYTVRGKAAMG